MNVSGIALPGRDAETVLEVRGDLDVAGLAVFQAAVAARMERRPATLLLDFEHVRFIDSAGLGALLGILQCARDYGGTVKIVCTDPRMRTTFAITGLAGLFGMGDDRTPARAIACGSSRPG